MVLKTKIKTIHKLKNYIPYAFHFNHQSILTKNGELIIVLKLENRFDEDFKKIIIECFAQKAFARYAIWLTTINEKSKKTDHSNKFFSGSGKQNGFEFELEKAFSTDSNKEEDFFQEIFLSFVFNDDVNISDLKFNLVSLVNFSQRNYMKKLSKLYMKANAVISNFLYELKKYQPKTLAIVEENGVFYCEILNFFSRINFVSKYLKKTPIGFNDLSVYLNEVNEFDYKILNQNIVKIQNSEIEKYCGVFSFKYNQNPEFNQVISKELLDNDFEFVSTEILIQSQKKQILNIKEKSYAEYQKKIGLQIENFDFIENNSLLKKFLGFGKNSLEKKKNDIDSSNLQKFFLKKNIFFIKADSLEELNFFSRNFFNKFSSKGYYFLRENIFLDQVFWCQMPGNFNFFDKIYINEIKNSFAFNDFIKSKDKWINEFFFKSKVNNGTNKIDLDSKKIFFFFDKDFSKDFFIFFLFYISKKSILKISYINPDNAIFEIFKNKYYNKEKNKSNEQISTNLSVDLIIENKQTDQRRIKEIFDLVFSLIKVLWLMKVFSTNDVNSGSKFYETGFENDQSQINEIKNLAKRISIELNLNIKSLSFEAILKILSQKKIFKNNSNLTSFLKSLNASEIFAGINFFKKNSFGSDEKPNQKILLIFVLIKILERHLRSSYSLLSDSDLIFIINFENSQEFDNLDLILKEISFMTKNHNVFFVLNLKTDDIRSFLKIYNSLVKESIFFALNQGSKEIIEILNPNFSGDQNFFENLLLVINDSKFLLNEFPSKKLNNIIEGLL